MGEINIQTNDKYKKNIKKVFDDIKYAHRDHYSKSKLFKYNLPKIKQKILNTLRINEALKAEEKIKLSIKDEVVEPEPQYPEEMMSEDRKIKANYTFLKNCVEYAPIVPLDISLKEGITKRISECIIPENIDKIQSLFDEIEELYVNSIREILVKHSLKVPQIEGIPTSTLLNCEYEKELSCVYLKSDSKEYYRQNGVYIANNLFSVHSILRNVMIICNTHFSGIKMVNFTEMRNRSPVELNSIKNNAILDCEHIEEMLMSKWYPAVINLFIVNKTFKKLNRRKQSAIFNCVNTLIANKIRNLLNNSMDELKDLFKIENFKKTKYFQDKEKSSSMYFGETVVPQLKVDLMFEKNDIMFYPLLDDIIQVYHEVVDIICSTMQNVAQIKSWLSGTSPPLLIKTSIGKNTVDELKKYLSSVLTYYFEQPTKQMNVYKETFKALINGDEQTKVNVFVSKKRLFDEYKQIVQSLKDKQDDVYRFNSIYYYFMVRMDVQILHDTLLLKIRKLKTTCLESMEQYHMIKCTEIIRDFENFEKKSLTKPENTFELMDLNKFVEDVRLKKMKRIKKDINKSVERMRYLLCEHILPESSMEINTTLLNWPGKVNAILDKNDEIVKVAQELGEELLEHRKEKTILEINKMMQRCGEFVDMGDISMCSQYLNDVRYVQKKISELTEDTNQINTEKILYKQQPTEFNELDQMTDIIDPYYILFSLVFKWQRSEKKWMDGSFNDLSADSISLEVEEFLNDLFKIRKVFQKEYRRRKAEVDELKRAANRAKRRKSKDLTQTNVDEVKPPASLTICDRISDAIEQFQEKISVIEIMCNPGIRQRHWNKNKAPFYKNCVILTQCQTYSTRYPLRMTEISTINMTPDSGTTLRKILKLELDPYMEEFEQISIAASKEHSLERNMVKMNDEWEEVYFGLGNYRESEISILSSVDDIQLLLEDQIIKTQTMRGSPFIKPFQVEIKEWEMKLIRMQNTIDQWLKVQSQWLYLEPIFCSADIMSQMPEEGRLFKTVDRTWRDVMKNTKINSKVIHAATLPNLLERLTDANVLLEKINKGLNNYLENKRLYFSRFFFLSNDEMLEILSETKDPKRVQPHLKKCFEGIDKLQFDKDMDILAMISSEGEKIKLSIKVSTSATKGLVEKWLLLVQESMLLSIHDVINQARIAYTENERCDWVRVWPGQIVLCVSQIYWSADIEAILIDGGDKKGIINYGKQLDEQLNDIVNLVRGKLNKQERITLGALVVIDVHARDVLYDLVNKNVTNELDFNWLCQLRYYWEDKCTVKIVNAMMNYGCEYLGNSGRLVITPLTDRCYRTLMGAYQLNLNGAPEGPAGTGKTETTKDLAKAMGVHCVVFNCSDGLDYLAMGKFFKGLAASGAWACFDEFNRIDLEVLSVVAQQILYIIRAIQADLKRFIFEGTEIDLNKNCYVAITMNPGYAGRSELPDNLKALFRTVAMMVPEYAMIGEIMLYSFGFMNARNLSVKICTTYRLCSEQLSTQPHYDYGMRAVKAVLSAAGNLKLKFPNENEDILLLRSIKDVNLPKFLSHDIPLFDGIISDLFPGIDLKDADYSLFLKIVNRVCQENNIQNVPFFRLKLIQLYEMMIVRHGFMLVGEPFSAKSTLLQTIATTLTIMSREQTIFDENNPREEPVIFQIVNPKSVDLGQLYGRFDIVSHEWSDGIISNIFRDYASSNSNERKWIILDGPVDAVWIESMNTVLDDNKKLCLVSGEVIQMSSNMSLIFETLDLLQASPATVSRCGMIYLEPTSLGWKPLFDSWINTWKDDFKEEHIELVQLLFNWLVNPCLDFIKKNCQMYMECGQIHFVKSLMNLVYILIKSSLDADSGNQRYFRHYIQAAMMFGLAWSLGGLLDQTSRPKFDVFLRNLHENKNEDYPIPNDLGVVSEVVLPEKGVIYDYFYETKARGKWKTWFDQIKNIHLQPTKNIQNIMVPTIDTARYSFLMDLFIKYEIPMLFVGLTGTGKSIYVQKKLMDDLSRDKYMPMFINFSAQTSTDQFQMLLLSKLDKKGKGTYGPPVGKKAIIFVDDVNIPTPTKYFSQPPVELYRQILDQGYMYNTQDTSKINLKDVLFVSAMNPPGGSKHSVSRRFMHYFNIMSIESFSDESLTRIFTTMYRCYFKAVEMPNEYQKLGDNIVEATKLIYKKCISHLLPTPNKSHYVFNLRDFSRIISGVCLCKREQIRTKTHLIRLWVHESLRVFYDRLLDANDREWVVNTVRIVTDKIFNETFEKLFMHLLENEEDRVSENEIRSLMWGDFMDPDADDENRVYQEVTSLNAFLEIVQQKLEEYNNTFKTPMNLVIFRYVLEHLSRISRIIRLSGGHALLVGMGGSGRQSLTRLAAYMANMKVFQPEISKNYGITEWHDDLKKILTQTGANSIPTVFLLSDNQIKYESFLEDLDSLLNSGEVPNIFANDEKGEIMEMVRPAAQLELEEENDGKNVDNELSPLALFAFFVRQTKKYLHIVLTFSPIGSAFRTRLPKFPSLINCCTIDWFQPWPQDALRKLSKSYLNKSNIEDEEKIECTNMCTLFHSTVKDLSVKFRLECGRYNYVTPTSYLVLIELFQKLFKFKQTKTSQERKRYLVGLEKLAFASEQIGKMQIELEELQPKLVISAEENIKMIGIIEIESKEVDVTKIRVAHEEKIVSEQAASSQSLRDECEHDLSEAIPALKAAQAALNTLKPSDITIVKSMKNPPSGVKLVMAAVCVMKEIKPEKINDPSGSGQKIYDYWGPSKRLLGDMNFLRDLKDYNRDNIPLPVMQKIRKEYISNSDFDPNKVAQASQAAEGLCRWIQAMEIYDRVVKIVEPKKKALAAADQELSETMSALKLKQDELNEIIERLDNLNASFVEKQTQKANLEYQVKLCATKLERAEQLIAGLGGEKDRWILAAEKLKTVYENILGDTLISAAMIAYLGPFTPKFRESALVSWTEEVKRRKLPGSVFFSLSNTLGDPVLIQQWNLNGLPKDSFSIDNAIIVSTSRRWPLLIDPQAQANIWIKNFERTNKLVIIKFTDSDYMRNLENAITFGKPLLLENIDETLDASLEPLLLKQIFKQGGVKMIRLGDIQIEYSDDFRFYITTKLRNPHYLPDVATKVTLINFMITPQGLEDQLLGMVVAKEKPELEAEREALIISSASNNKQLKEIEDKILHTLSASEGNILEDESAIVVLNKSKILSNEISKKQLVARETEKKINETRQGYQPVATLSSILYFSIADLPNIDPMYQYSLSWFINLYLASINDSNKSKILERRLRYLQDYFTYSLYCNICRSLFQQHKLLFSFILCTNLLIGNKELDVKELNFFLTGDVTHENEEPNPASSWLGDRYWDDLCKLKTLQVFQDFKSSFVKNLRAWKEYCEDLKPHERILPDGWDEKLNKFQQLIVLRYLRFDKVIPSITQYITEKLGHQFVEPPPFDLNKSFGESKCTTPLIFVLSPGADPTMALLAFAEEKGFTGNKFQSISLGQGQGGIACRIIAKAQIEGQWVLLQNCHLAISFMERLEKICESLSVETCHSEFRIWLTSYSSDKFPVIILQNSIKITNEPPAALKINMLQSYSSDPISNESFFDSCGDVKNVKFHRLLYGICFFHAVVQERRKFGPIGWNIPYGFNESDLSISVRQLQIFIKDYDDVPFDAIIYLTGHCNYGGRVTDDNDRRLLMSILKIFCNKDLLSERYSFSTSKEYQIPIETEYQDYIDAIKNLNTSQPPQIFGLHDNAEITKDMADSEDIIDDVLKIRGAGVGGGSEGNNIIETVASDVISKLPENFNLENAKKKFPLVYKESMNTVLVQEMERFNNLLDVIRKTLTDLLKALKGLVVMSTELEYISNALAIGKIPESWMKLSYPSLKNLAAYITDLLVRIHHLQEWYEHGKPTVFWISGFFFTQAFLTGTLQNYARKTITPIDTITFDFQVLDYSDPLQVKKGPDDGVYVTGLFLDGVRWNKRKHVLAEQKMRVLYDPLPILWIFPITKTDLKINNRYNCPLYKTSERRGILLTTGHSTNFVLNILLDSDVSIDHWIRRGAALLCQIND
ncbi:Dynein heavy chain 12, axonemal [Intoshia linei]|uniref:Dynein heavy chain 12, axonemal n=1 Tax=Intoshia linei TaxID=1819745 RepID=A0A177BC80_9BILA|nr:Dynein heavy chain 12, axonemal [Intoshia linei]